jgi:hypothetical protein
MKEFSQTQAHKLVDENPEAAFHRIYAVKMLAKDPSYKYDPSNVPTLDELLLCKQRLMPLKRATAPRSQPRQQQNPERSRLSFRDNERNLMRVVDFDWRNPDNDEQFVDDRERAMAKTIRGLEQKAIAESKSKSELTEKLSKLEKSVEKITTDSRPKSRKQSKKDLDTS